MNGKSKPHIHPSSLDRSKSSKSLVRRLFVVWFLDVLLTWVWEWHFGWHKLSKSSANDNFIEANVIRKGLSDRAGSIIGMMHILLCTKRPRVLGWVRWHLDAENDKCTYLHPYGESILDIVATLGDSVCWTISIYNPGACSSYKKRRRDIISHWISNFDM
jgi:hypothetical protein